MRREFDEELGPVRYSYTEREKESLFSFPLNSLLVIVTCHQNSNPAIFANQIIPMINSCKIKINQKSNNYAKEIINGINKRQVTKEIAVSPTNHHKQKEKSMVFTT